VKKGLIDSIVPAFERGELIEIDFLLIIEIEKKNSWIY